MDTVVRQVGQHIEFEPEWETAFNLQIKLGPCITLLLEWCASDVSTDIEKLSLGIPFTQIIYLSVVRP